MIRQGELEGVTEEQLEDVGEDELTKLPDRTPDVVVETKADNGTGSIHHHTWVDAQNGVEIVLVTSDITAHGNFVAEYDLNERMFAKFVMDAETGSDSMDLHSISEEAKNIALALA
ncbi:hypothetical protein G3I44_13640 [Halogeometricum borinquense]|uniref:Uncharacterized protein n=1 Tax=Halogeometricum borinquense TaxID=60847 RepID=A0A6C0UI89_9EURY|nr:hypothetical protein [Halogeometricum borinquense]QIB75236.1 hypothetical protein G3I44_13640 [Halogeometricum borinquense]